MNLLQPRAEEYRINLSVGKRCKNIVNTDGGQASGSILINHCANTICIGLCILFPHSRERSSEYLVVGSRDVQLHLIHYLRGQEWRKLCAQHRQDYLVSGEKDVFDSFSLDNPFKLLNDFLAVAEVEILNGSLISAKPPTSKLRPASDLFTRYNFPDDGTPEAKNEDARGVCVRDDGSIGPICVLQLGQRIQMGLMIDVQAVYVDWGIELERFEKIACSPTGEDCYTVRRRPKFGSYP